MPKGPNIRTTLDFTDFKDFVVQENTALRFGMKGLDGFTFNVADMVIDNSEHSTPSNVSFPKDYFTNSDEQNLWCGLSFNTISVTIPRNIGKTPDDTTGKSSCTIACDNLIIDSNGLSVEASFRRAIDTSRLSKTDWDFMSERFGMRLVKTRIDSLGFSGYYTVPPFGIRDARFSAGYNRATHTFDILSSIGGDKRLNLFCADLTLNESSFVEIKMSNGKFSPTISADGTLSINTEKVGPPIRIPDFRFEGMTLSAEKPYFKPGTWSMNGKVETPKLAGFDLKINDVKYQDDQLEFNAKLSLMDDMISAEGGFGIKGDFENYKVRSVQVNKFNVDYKQDAFSISGGVEIQRNDAVYGNGFRGDVSMSILDRFSIDAIALFGKKNSYRYFFVDLFVEKKSGIFNVGPMTVSGLGGGLYKRMDQTANDYPFGKALSGICYYPNSSVGMGFFTSARFFVGSDNAVSASTTLEMQFNSNWGLNYVQLLGDVQFMNPPSGLESLNDRLQNRVLEIDKIGGNSKLKETSQDEFQKIPVKKDGSLTASILMKYDNVNRIFNADLNAYLNAGIIRGVGFAGKFANAKARFGDSGWYIHMGRPDDRCGIEVLNLLRLDGYFMMGNEIPALPMPPSEVTKNWSQELYNKFLSRHDNGMLSLGKGVAFGGGFQYRTAVTPWPFFAEIKLGSGFEFLLADYGKNAHCQGKSGPIGINGWYAEGQLWAYLDAAVGMKVKIFKKERKFNIFNLGASAVLNGKGPNPFYFTGVVNGHYKILGGLIKGNATIDFEVGEQCKPVGEKRLLEQEIIAQITPGNGARDVNVFASPQLLLNIAADEEFLIEDENGQNSRYKIRVEKFDVSQVDSGTPMKGKISRSDDGLVYSFDPEEPFESQKQYKAIAKVTFLKKNGNNWEPVNDESGSYDEQQQVTFTAGDRPKHILPEHIVCSYPRDRQYNYMKGETSLGYICTSKSYAYLFTSEKPEGYNQKIAISKLGGDIQQADFTFKACNDVKGAVFEVDFDMGGFALENTEIYTLQILNIPIGQSGISDNVRISQKGDEEEMSVREISADGTFNQLENKQICAIRFRTSKYDKLTVKINSLQQFSGLAVSTSDDPYLKSLYLNLETDDFFDVFETQTAESGETMVEMTCDLDNTDWYRKSIYSKIYRNYSQSEFQNKRIYDYPPNDAIVVQCPMSINHEYLTDNEIKTGIATGLPTSGNVGYYAIWQCQRDLNEIRQKISGKAARGVKLSQTEQEILNCNMPVVYTNGDYPYTIAYKLPGKNIVTSSTKQKFIKKD